MTNSTLSINTNLAREILTGFIKKNSSRTKSSCSDRTLMESQNVKVMLIYW